MEKSQAIDLFTCDNKKGLINQTFRMGLTFELILRPRNFGMYMQTQG